MKRKQTTITEELDQDGKVVRRITETVEEEDDKYTVYPVTYPIALNTQNPYGYPQVWYYTDIPQHPNPNTITTEAVK